ncbi:DUF7594 domain-containing protein [Paenibacillus ferrarius]|uniref:CBM96 family carbohydrate-binding protein n=1 Tax=Paenibacillus ferrarius TaxID=1469647 RepID=UPI003D28F057
MKGLRNRHAWTFRRGMAALLTALLLWTAGLYEASVAWASEAPLTPTDDTYANAGTKSEQTFGSSSDLLVKYQAADPNVTRQAYLRFDVKGFQPEAVGSAKLRIYGSVTEPGVSSVRISVYGGGQDGWAESTMNWGSKPESEFLLGRFNVTPTAGWYEVDVTSYIRKQAGEDGTATLILTQETSPGYVVTFKSKEDSLHKPQLIVSDTAVQPDAPSWSADSALLGKGASGSALFLSWTPASSGNGEITGYRLYRNGELLLTLPGTTKEYTVTGLTDGKRYSFQVQAGDSAGRWSTDGPIYSTIQTRIPTDDAYVNAGTSADKNFGQSADLLVKNNVADLTRRSYMRFDLNGMKPEEVGSAKLMIYGAITEAGPTSLSTSVAGGEVQEWSESSITWMNKPDTEHYLGKFTINRTMKWNEVDVTSYLRKQAQGDGLATFSLFQEISPGYATVFKSKEDIHKPYLLVSALPADGSFPAWPAGSELTAVDVLETSLKLSWTKPVAFGGASVTGYRIYKNGVFLQELPATTQSLDLNGLESDSRYTFQVQAGDSAGRWSTDGPLVTVRMPGNEILQVKQGNVFVQPDSAQFKVRTGRSNAQWVVEDAWGREVKRGSSPVSRGELLLSVPMEKKGYFTVRISLEAPGLEPVVLSTPFSVLSPFDVKAVLDSPFGFATHLHRTGTGWGPELIDLIQASGAKNVRDGIEWNGIEKQKGQYTFAPVPDNYMAKLKEQQEDMLFVAGYNNPLYDNNSTPYTDEGRQGFADYVKSYFNHYGTQLKWLEVYNEFNIAFGDRGNGPADSRPDYYYPLLKKTYETVKAERPDVTVVGMATAGVPLSWMEEVFKLGGLQYMDAVSIHPYQYPAVPEGLIGQLAGVQNLIRQYNNGHSKPLWISEFGWPTQEDSRGIDEKTQADYLVRGHVLALAGGVEKIFWYDFMNDGTKADYNEDNFGIIRNATDAKGKHTPKPAYSAYAAMTRELTGADYVQKEATPDGIYSYAFRKDGTDLHIAWSLSPQSMVIQASGPVDITDLMGNTQTYTPLDGKVYITLSGEPVYIKGTIEGLVQDSTFTVTSGDKAVATEKVQLDVRLVNPLGKPLTVSLASENQTADLTADAHGTVSGTIKLGAVDHSGIKYVRGDLLSGGKRIGYLTHQVRIGEPYEIRVRPVVADVASHLGKMNLTVTNRFSGQSLRVLKVDWAMNAQTGSMNSGWEVAPLADETFSWEVGTVDYDKSYPYQATVDLEGFGPITLSGKVEYNPIAYKTVQVDGVLDDAAAPLIDLSKANNKISGYGGPDDASGLVWLNADRDNLYISAKVTDNVWAYPAGGGDQWQNDGFQFALAAGVPGESKVWYEFGMAETPAGPQIYRFLSPAGLPTGRVDNGNLVIFRDEAQHTTTYELALPWSEIKSIRPETDEVVSFSLLLNDNDGVQRRGYIEWGSGIGGTKDPKLFRTIEWMKPGSQLKLEPAEGTYSDSIELRATLTDPEGRPINGETVDFEVEGGLVGSAVTNQEGTASILYTIKQGAASSAETVDYTTSALYKPEAGSAYKGSAAESKLTVRKEQASLSAVSPSLITVGSGQTLDVALVQNDAEPGRMEGIPVGAVITRLLPNGTPGDTVVTEAVYSTDASGTAHLPVQLAAGLYEIRYEIQPNPYYQTASTIATVLVADRLPDTASLNGFLALSGGGGPLGQKAGKLHLTLTGERTPGGELSGMLRLHAEPQGLDLTSRSLQWLAAAGSETYIQAEAEDQQANLYLVRIIAASGDDSGSPSPHISLQIWKQEGDNEELFYAAFLQPLRGNVTFQ